VQKRLAEPELTESAGAVSLPGHQAAVIKSLVVFDSDDQAAFVRSANDVLGMIVPKDQRFDRADVEIVFKGFADHRVMDVVGCCDDGDAVGRGRPEHFSIEFRVD